MTEIKNANAPGRHPRGIPYHTQTTDGTLSSMLDDQLICFQPTIEYGLNATKIHGGAMEALFFRQIHTDPDFIVDRLAAFGMDAAVEAAGETGGEA